MVFSLTTAGVALTTAAVTLVVLSYSSRPRAARCRLLLLRTRSFTAGVGSATPAVVSEKTIAP